MTPKCREVDKVYFKDFVQELFSKISSQGGGGFYFSFLLVFLPVDIL